MSALRAELAALRAERDALRAEKDRLAGEAADARARLAEAQAMERAAKARAEEIATEMDDTRDALEHERQERMALQTRLAAIEAQAQEREQAINTQIAQLTEVRGQLQKDFEALAATALRQNEQQFLRMAEETMKRHREGSSADLAKTRAELEALLNPVKDTLARYEKGMGEVEKARVEAYGSLKQQIEHMLNDQGQLRAETQKLVHALKSGPKARGRWGEQQLRNVLEMAGLSAYVDFQTEVHVDTGEDGALRPDAIINLPGGRQLIVDAKTSLVAFLDAAEAPDEGTRHAHLLSHAKALKTHADQLGRKEYWRQFGKAADFVVMFVPGEHFVTAALEVDPDLWDFAFERRVLLATPTNLIAIARTVSHVWQQEKLAEQAELIGQMGKDLYNRLRVMGNHVSDLGKAVDTVVRKYNGFVGSLERNVLPQARKFGELQFESQAEPLVALEPSEQAVRQPDRRGRDLTFDGDAPITAPPSLAALPRTEVTADAEE
ncbi:DNA recombination protein RmuC [Pedomonas mirosovicensis]|uniref:DNA recombination protein RmuC n=1 Tax=Pedomonas mirosovicensis TaxID=2908641 RepID=UPI00216869A3|nr:DNA recombination protein RmuC [Pedomonas mirosovicensis]MCH8685678.1 DNA recombination protein RmuC [Pedomonas mirosovicensis]